MQGGPRRVAIVHDYLTQFGGAERVLLALMKLFPHAPVFTLVYDRNKLPVAVEEGRLKTSFLQRLPLARRHYRYFPLLMPLAVEQFDFSNYELVLSATHSFGKGVITGSETLHISYCFTPTRYVWDDSHRYVREFSRSTLFQRFAPLALSYIRLWDYFAAQRVDTYITLSRYVARRIAKYYHRTARVVPPPVGVDRFKTWARLSGRQAEHGNYYLIVSRLVPYKRVDLAIEACEKLGRRLLIAGVGPEEEALRKVAKRTTTFLGFVGEEELPALYSGARALLFPQEEDFGITPLEAAACGKPTIALRAGGAVETIKELRTGLFFEEQTVEALAQAIQQFETAYWDAKLIRRHAQRFSEQLFERRLQRVIQEEWRRWKNFGDA